MTHWPAAAQQAAETDPELVRSIGQPQQWRPFAAGGIGLERSHDGRAFGTASLGVERSIGNPLGGFLALGADAWVKAGNSADGGLRALIHSPLLFVHAGADHSVVNGRTDFVAGATVPLRRGGWPITGSTLRAHWIPSRHNSVELNLVVPVAQPYAGRTRPRTVEAQLPIGQLAEEAPALLLDEPTYAAWKDTRASMTQLVTMLTFFWLIEDRNLRYSASVREWREVLADFGAEFFPEGVTQPGESQYQREAVAYHDGLARVFAHAAGAATDSALGQSLATGARRIALVEIALPYNRTYGQYRSPNSLHGLRVRAHDAFDAWLREQLLPDPDAITTIGAAFDAWTAELERLRAKISGIAGDPRVVWIPLGLVLHPEEHRTQAQIDELVTLAMERPFERGNTAFTIDAPQFQVELKRTIRETRRSHVLWVHDYRGVDELGDPDRTAFEITVAYLSALRDAAAAYDSTGVMPAFFILVDQHFWEVTRGRMWMRLLERPLSHRMRLGPRFAGMQRELDALQDSLRAAVASSGRMRDEATSRGKKWIPGLVKVHVNITNPVDFTFRTRRISMPLSSDNLLRDHRKMILRDPDESDPASGEVIFAGVGVGNHYASATWEDRAMIVRGPVVASTLRYLRATLERHTLRGAGMPPMFRRDTAAGFTEEQIRSREAAGATAHVMQTHNEVGWGRKESSFVQMLLYDVAPAGSMIFVPDALWSSYQWMAQLVGAALRGCRVYVVAPGKQHAPADGFPWMSAQQELVTRAVLVDEILGDVIRSGGGDLRVGLYARTQPLDDYSYSLESVVNSWHEHEFLRAIAPLSAGALAELQVIADHIRPEPAAIPFISDARGRLPLLHRKTQWIMGGSVLHEVAASPALPAALSASVQVHRFGGLGAQASDSMRLRAVSGLFALLPESRGNLRDDPLYFATGSINKNPRSMMVDAEVLGVVSGQWTLESFLDMLVLLGTTTWVGSLQDANRLLPPYSRQQRRLGRWLYPII